MNIQVHHERGVYGKLVLRVDWSIDDIILASGVELTKEQAERLIRLLARDFNPHRGINVNEIQKLASKVKGK